MKRSSFIAVLALLGLAGAAQAQPAASPAPIRGLVSQLIPDQYIVELAPGEARGGAVRQAALGLVGSVGGGELLQVYGHALNGFSVRLPAVAAEALARNPRVRRIEQDRSMFLSETQFNPPSYGLDRIDQVDLPLDNQYSYPASAGQGVHVYVIDTGLNATHVDFAGDRVQPGRNFAPNGSQGLLCTLLGIGCPPVDPANTTDCNGHGTHVSGTSVGSSFGVAKRALLHPVRVFGCGNSTTTSAIIAGVDWVTANRQLPAVVNMSLGGGASELLDTAVNNLIDAGVTAVVAAGNENANACSGSPSRVPRAITIGATTNTDARASYSNFGTCVDLFAPGSNIVSAAYNSATGTATLSGTSMASPHVAGAAARYLAANPGANAAAVDAALKASASSGKVGNPGTGSPNLLLRLDPVAY
ncbi:S8 family peptidase [Solimonas sp. K1W22B-7]|uniref:S8 family peptidase n=1 Tax=Solimonas sp. K1W22B-7 TaxID=2303331 RepID=UPI000E3307F3|nr:S8 family peptidase [Solimonas sp. K1W22B-7]AXQ27693.1 S8 family peptidase [Solimonas sp. K1W22B-7]